MKGGGTERKKVVNAASAKKCSTKLANFESIRVQFEKREKAKSCAKDAIFFAFCHNKLRPAAFMRERTVAWKALNYGSATMYVHSIAFGKKVRELQ